METLNYYDYVTEVLEHIPSAIPSVMLTYARNGDAYELIGMTNQKHSFAMNRDEIRAALNHRPIVRLPYMLRPFDGVNVTPM